MADTLLCYDFEVRMKRDSNLRDLSCFDNKNDLYDIMYNWINELGTKKITSPDFKRTIHREASSTIEKEGRCIIGSLRTSRTGTGSDILDGDTLVLKVHKNPDDLEAIDPLFLIYVPVKGRQGKIILQNHDGVNASTCLKAYFLHRFGDEYTQYKLDIRPSVFSEIIDEFIKRGELLELELKRRITDQDEIDALNPDVNRFDNPYITITYKADGDAGYLKRSAVGSIRNIYEKRQKRIYLNIEFENASLTLEHNGKVRKMPMEELYKRCNTWPLPDDISLDINSVPVYAQVKIEAKGLLPDNSTD